jgi:hypothetical protein
MEIPYLSLSTIWNLDYHVSVVDEVEVSVVWKFGDNIEISFDVKSESLIEFSLGWFSLPFISIHNVPLLVDLSMFRMNNDVSVLVIVSS